MHDFISFGSELKPEFDENGFLVNPDNWTDEVANLIAMREGLFPLTTQQWQIIYALREHYMKTGGVPALRHICHHEHMDDHCVTSLFHQDVKEAWRLAGLPDPGEEARAYM
jgi:tRNA 2-thiouridine synthesizing protein E